MLTIKSREEGPIAVLDLSGLLQAGRASMDLQEAVTRLIDEGKNNIVMNIADVVFIDSSGIGEVVNGFTMAKKSGGALKLAGVQDRVREVFRVTGLLGVLDIHDSEPDALASFD